MTDPIVPWKDPKTVTVWAVVAIASGLLLWEAITSADWLEIVKFVLGVYFGSHT